MDPAPEIAVVVAAEVDELALVSGRGTETLVADDIAESVGGTTLMLVWVTRLGKFGRPEVVIATEVLELVPLTKGIGYDGIADQGVL